MSQVVSQASTRPPRRNRRPHTYIGSTTSVCPVCRSLVPAKVLCQDGRVYFDKFCPAHGGSKALVEEDVGYYLEAVRYAQPGSVPLTVSMPARGGCPHDCGLCPRHEQHCCHPIIEITNRCNLDCPICMADHAGKFDMPEPAFRRCVEHLLGAEGSLENLTLSGGEPTLHPQLLDFIALATRPEIARVSLVTNGLRIAQDAAFCDALARSGAYVILQFDGLDAAADCALRGRDLVAIRQQALAQLEAHSIPCQLLFVAARHVNEHQLGQALDLLLQKPFILSLAVQPLADAREGIAVDPLDRLTVSGTIRALARQSRGVLRADDFFPLPCPDPRCVSLTYLLGTAQGEWVPIPRFADIRRHLTMLAESATIAPSQELEDSLHEIVSDLWSTAGECPRNERVVSAVRRLFEGLADRAKDGAAQRRVLETSAKSIFIHHYMDRHTFDLARVPKCCHQYSLPDGRLMPICTYNLFHRSREGS
jgi:uncharacterized radical SAM superfamily Fe-S cluster-containing enzyme